MLRSYKKQGVKHPLFNPSAAELLMQELSEQADSVGLTIKEAVEEACAARRTTSSIALGEFAEVYLESLQGRSAAHVKAAKRIVGSLVEFLGCSAVVDVLEPVRYEAWERYLGIIRK